ncbi:MAG: glycosyltransferase family 2 protein [Limisphaerales bacterium]
MISIVIPVFNEAKVLRYLFKELDRVSELLASLGNGIEVILVNDGSADESWDLISARCLSAPNYIGVNLSRNFGHQAALVAGLETATGDMVVSIDADLQDPPDLIPKLVEKHREGFDVVYATRIARGEETWIKRLTADWFYSTMQKVSGVQIPKNTGDFRLMSRKAVREFVKLNETHRFLRGLAPWIGFRQAQVFYDRADRKAGATHYSMRKMLNLAFDGITSMSKAPLRLAYVLCVLLFAIYLGYICWVAINHFLLGSTLVPGWTSIMGAITIFGTIQLLSLGIFGEYVGRIYEQSKQRPLYIIADLRRGACPTIGAASCDLDFII